YCVCSFAGVLGQYNVHQSEFQVVAEEEPFQINCSYTGTEYSLQWYRQLGDSPPQSILYLSTNGYRTEQDFTMFLDTNNKFTFLYLNSTRVEDSAVYFCAMRAL
ncbi:hypothetical protein FKM82_018298, partial [Ascaphus truei]